MSGRFQGRGGLFAHPNPWAALKKCIPNMFEVVIWSSTVYLILLIFIIAKKAAFGSQKKRNQACHIYHVDVCNAAYIKSHIAASFKQAKYLQNLSVKNSKSQ